MLSYELNPSYACTVYSPKNLENRRVTLYVTFYLQPSEKPSTNYKQHSVISRLGTPYSFGRPSPKCQVTINIRQA